MVLALAIDAWSLISLVLEFAAIVWLRSVQFLGHGDHEAEDDQGAFFDEHGRWPDEPESAARIPPRGSGGDEELPVREH